jgi:hypothetical protein
MDGLGYALHGPLPDSARHTLTGLLMTGIQSTYPTSTTSHGSCCKPMAVAIECCVCGRSVEEGNYTLAEYVEQYPGGIVCELCSGSD